jgi:hypothetical protein
LNHDDERLTYYPSSNMLDIKLRIKIRTAAFEDHPAIRVWTKSCWGGQVLAMTGFLALQSSMAGQTESILPENREILIVGLHSSSNAEQATAARSRKLTADIFTELPSAADH